MKTCRIVMPLLILSVVLACAGCGGSNTAKTDKRGTTVVDDLGRKVAVPDNPKRIVSLASSTTEILYDLGCGDLVVGVDKNSDYPPEVKEKTVVGTGANLNTEELLSLNPDLVFAWYYDKDAIGRIEELDIPVIAINPESVDGVYKTIEMVGRVTGEQARAGELVLSMRAEIAAVTEKVDTVPKDKWPRVYYELTPMHTVGPGTFSDEIIGLAGGLNIAQTEGTRYPVLSNETIIEKDPNVIVAVSYGTPVKEIKERGGWSETSAVKDDRVYSIDSDIVTCTPRLVEGLKQMARWFHPELFKDS